ncbi:MAG TPA: hypothetical protein VFM55_09850 [Micromonosporaceae bacterium]|nr:hypothetical protein [Micromonosporaceae bacterium]
MTPVPGRPAVPAAAARGGPADVVYLLLLLQAGFGLVAMLGGLLLMGNPVYLLAPVAKAVTLFVLATKVVSGRRWAWITVLVLEGLGLVGFWLSLLGGLLPMLTRTVTLTGLLTEVGIPVVVIYFCARTLVDWRLSALSRGVPAGPPAPAGGPFPAGWPVPAGSPAPAGPPLPAGWPVPAGWFAPVGPAQVGPAQVGRPAPPAQQAPAAPPHPHQHPHPEEQR